MFLTGMESEIRGAGESGDPLHSMTEAAAPHTCPACPAACGHHEDRRLVSDPRVRVPVSEDPSVALKPQAGLPPCSQVSECLLPPGLPKCQPLCLDFRTAFMSPSWLLNLRDQVRDPQPQGSHLSAPGEAGGGAAAAHLVPVDRSHLSPGACSLFQLLFLNFMSEAETRNRSGSQWVSTEYLRVKDFLFCSLRRVGADELCVCVCMHACVSQILLRD